MKQLHTLSRVKKTCIVLFIFLAAGIPSRLMAADSEKQVFELIEYSYSSGRYYNAITESMRYEFFYPEGTYLQKTYLITGLAYFEGGDYSNAIESTRISMRYHDEKLQAEAMHNIIYMRMLQGSVFLAQNDMNLFFREYSGIDTDLDEKIFFEQVSAYAYQENFKMFQKQSQMYRDLYPDGKYSEDLYKLEKLVDEEQKRPKKKLGTALLGSAFIPGFSHFYTGDYRTGTFSFLSNALLIGLLTNAVMNKNYFEIVIFSFMEMSFYQNSLISSYRNVENYNSRSDFKKEIKLQVERRF